ncbi:hypothetical protein B0H14DRAFT_2639034 [Mycena olivaceomarginata]|nr:hypothetical protein B0H14DRAFT_2639034 [Mycena olivaceomarginata]
MYHSLCPPAYNEETIYLIDNDPLCQYGSNVAGEGTSGVGSRKRLRGGVVLVQLSSISAAIKQLEGIANPPKAPAKCRKAVILKIPRAPMETVKAQFLVEKKCYYAFLNGHFENPPLELTTLDCIAASALALPRLIPPRSSGSNSDSAQSKKLKLKAKERKPAHASLRKFRKKLRVDEQLAGRFRHHPPSLFLPSPLSSTNYYTHMDSLFEVIRQIQADINQKREEARKETNRKAPYLIPRRPMNPTLNTTPTMTTHLMNTNLHDLNLHPTIPSRCTVTLAEVPRKEEAGFGGGTDQYVYASPSRTLQKVAGVSKDYGPAYRVRIR